MTARLGKAVALFGFLALCGGAAIGFAFAQVAEFLTSHIYGFGVFKSSDHARISHLIAPFAIQIPFYLAGTVLTQAFSAIRQNFWIALGSGLNLVFHILLTGYLVQRAATAGVALATSLTYLFSSVILATFLIRALGRLKRD